MILVDTSAWIEWLRATGSAADARLHAALEAEEPLATTGVVILELLAGALDDHHANELAALLARCELIAASEPADHEAGAAIYRACRRTGATIRRLPDCLIAAIAIRTQATLLQRDSDFERIAAVTGLVLAC